MRLDQLQIIGRVLPNRPCGGIVNAPCRPPQLAKPGQWISRVNYDEYSPAYIAASQRILGAVKQWRDQQLISFMGSGSYVGMGRGAFYRSDLFEKWVKSQKILPVVEVDLSDISLDEIDKEQVQVLLNREARLVTFSIRW